MKLMYHRFFLVWRPEHPKDIVPAVPTPSFLSRAAQHSTQVSLGIHGFGTSNDFFLALCIEISFALLPYSVFLAYLASLAK